MHISAFPRCTAAANRSAVVFGLVAAAIFYPTCANAQDGGVDAEELLSQPAAAIGPGSLLDIVAPDVADQVTTLRQDYGLAATIRYSVYAQTADFDGRGVAGGDLGAAARWTFFNRGRSDAASIVTYFEHRDTFSRSNGFEFAEDVGAGWFPHPIPNTGHTRLRQLYLTWNFLDDQVVTGVGKFSMRGLFNRSAYLGDRLRNFFSFAMSFDPSFNPPVDAFGAAVRVQPTDQLVSVMGGVFDADPNLNGFDVDVDGPFGIAELQFSNRPYRRALDPRQPDFVMRLTTYHRPETDSSREATGASAVVDWRIWDADRFAEVGEVGLGFRYGFQTRDAGALEQIASLGIVVSEPFGRARDAVGGGVAFTVTSDDDTQWSGETFYRLNVTDGFELSAGVQAIVDPAFSDDSLTIVPGIRTVFQF